MGRIPESERIEDGHAGTCAFRRIATEGKRGIIHHGTKFVPVEYKISFFSLRQEAAGFLLEPD
jgi:hypothetical protein